MQPTLVFLALVASKASSALTQFPTKMCLRLLGVGVFFVVAFRSCPLSSHRGLGGTDQSLDLCHGSGGALDGA